MKKYFKISSVLLALILFTGCFGNAFPSPNPTTSTSEGSMPNQTETIIPTESTKPTESVKLTSTPQKKDGFESVIIGVWHVSAGLPDELYDRYRFYDDHTFVFDYDDRITWALEAKDLNLKKAIVCKIGTWRIEDNKLILKITKEIWIEGGKIVKTEQDDYYRRNYTKKTVNLNPEIIDEYALKNFTKLNEKEYDVATYSVFIGNTQYWRISDDPDGMGDPWKVKKSN